jgi:hypothetical protein
LRHQLVVHDVLVIGDVSSSGLLEKSFVVQKGENLLDFFGEQVVVQNPESYDAGQPWIFIGSFVSAGISLVSVSLLGDLNYEIGHSGVRIGEEFSVVVGSEQIGDIEIGAIDNGEIQIRGGGVDLFGPAVRGVHPGGLVHSDILSEFGLIINLE